MNVEYIDPNNGSRYPVTRPLWRAPSGGHLNLTPGTGLKRADIDTRCYSVWRYAKAIRVPAAHAVSLGEGWTPIVPLQWQGIALQAKLEYMMPTGSFKDRGTA